jgi:hypothetical protein
MRSPRAASRSGGSLVLDGPTLLFSLGLFGFPIVATIIAVLGVDSRALSIPFRLLIAFLALLLILGRGRWQATPWHLLLLWIWLCYAARLFYDAFFAGIEGTAYSLLMFLSTCVIPAIALWKAPQIRFDSLARAGAVVATIGCLASLAGVSLGLFGQADITETTGRLSTEVLNPITLGHLAVSGLLCMLVLFRTVNLPARLLILLTVPALAYCLLQTGSKGPALAFAVCSLLWAVRRGYYGALVLIAAPVLAMSFLIEGNALADRIAGGGEDLSTLERVLLLQNSLLQIQASPIVGSASVEFVSGFYPHNIFVEAALAMGVPMAIAFVALVARGATIAWRAIGGERAVLGLLFIQSLISGLTSEALFGAATFWVTLVLLLKTRARVPAPKSAASAAGGGSLAVPGRGSGLAYNARPPTASA